MDLSGYSSGGSTRLISPFRNITKIMMQHNIRVTDMTKCDTVFISDQVNVSNFSSSGHRNRRYTR